MKFFVLSLLLASFPLFAQNKKPIPEKEATSTPEVVENENADKDRKKYQDLLKMKDQSTQTFYEQQKYFGLVGGYAGAYADANAEGLKVHKSSFQFGASLNYKFHPEFSLGGFLRASRFETSFIGQETWVIPFGVEAHYYATSFFYVGGQMGLAVETLGGHLELDFLFGPTLGLDFRFSESVSLGFELGVPVLFGSPKTYALLSALGQVRFWY